MTNDPRGVAELQRAEVNRILLERKYTNEEISKITSLANLLAADEGDDAVIETMYGYLSGHLDWKKDYAEFFSM